MSELKKMGRTINKRTIMESPKKMIYEAHFTAMEYELSYALFKKDYWWIRTRLEQHKLVLADDPNLPEKLRPRGKAILERFSKFVRNKKKSRLRVHVNQERKTKVTQCKGVRNWVGW
ncbi:MAG: hypothetical protein ACE5KJ_05140, partial [Candidatus Zixiibacteriota bacterium]